MNRSNVTIENRLCYRAISLWKIGSDSYNIFYGKNFAVQSNFPMEIDYDSEKFYYRKYVLIQSNFPIGSRQFPYGKLNKVQRNIPMENKL